MTESLVTVCCATVRLYIVQLAKCCVTSTLKSGHQLCPVGGCYPQMLKINWVIIFIIFGLYIFLLSDMRD